VKNQFTATVKSIIILALAALAVYQVSRLWLVELMDGNFFFYLQARFPQAVPDGQSAFTRPYRIVSGDGEIFEIRYSGIGGSEEWIFGENAIRAVLRDGNSVFRPDFGQPDYSYVLARPVLIYEYAFDMCAETFARALGLRNADVLTSGSLASGSFETFRAIAITPPDAENADLHMWVIASDGRIGQFMARNASAFQFAIPPVNPDGLHFIATTDGFLPQIPPGGFVYNRITAENPFRDPRGLITLSYSRSQVEPFFDNPAAIVPSARDAYTFTTRNTMVRYLENAVLEYTSFRTVGHAAQGSFMGNFSAALAFISSDPHVTNEIFLRNHEQRGRGHIFFFDYVIDNWPLVLTEEWATGQICTDPLFSPIEVTVEYGRVTRYRRLAYIFDTAEPARKNPDIPDEFFSLGFPISGDPEISLSVILE